MAFAALILLPGQVLAQSSTDTQNGTASCVVIDNPIALTEVENLFFGEILPTPDAGAVRIRVGGNANIFSNVVARADGNPGLWSVTGEPNGRFAITLPANNVISITNAAGDSMAVNNFESSRGAVSFLNASGDATFEVGATLSVAANQPPGVYTGTYPVTVNYD